MPTLNMPKYSYRPETMPVQLKRLLLEFLRANGKDRRVVAKALSCSPELLDQWINGEVTAGLLSTSLQRFVKVTGIQLDRLMVIQAKLQIQEQLKLVDTLRTEDPSYAFLLDLDPNLKDKIPFDDLLTRREIADRVKTIYEEIGGPLTGDQLFLESRNVVGWWDKKGGRLPSGKGLEKVIIRLVVGFVRDDPAVNSRDDTRFRVMAHLLLGREPLDVLGVRTLPEALRLLVGGKERWTTSALSCEIGIPEHALGALRKWTPGTSSGKMSPVTIVAIMKSLLKRNGQDHRVADLEQAFKTYSEKDSRGWSGKPVFWPREGETTVAQAQAAEIPVPSSKPAPAPAPAPEPALTIPLASDISLLARLEFTRAVSALQVLFSMFPQLRDLLPQDFTQAAETRKETPTAQTADDFANLGNGSGAMGEEELKLVVAVIRTLPRIMRRLLDSPNNVREQVLRRIDDPLVEMQGLLDAAGSTEPSRYLEAVVRPQSMAHELVSK